jgi:uncharacterized protein (DUF362 family)
VFEDVAVYRADRAQYASKAPFHPNERYPEYELGEIGAEPNPAYAAVRETFKLAGLDAARYGTPAWNPLGEFIRPGQFVLLKPNLVKETHPSDPNGWVYTMTHGSVIRAIADYVWKALLGRGRVMVGDAPHTDSSFDAIVRLLELDTVRSFYGTQNLALELVDFRKEQWLTRDDVVVERRQLPGDPGGYVAFDLGDRSEFSDHHGGGRYYGADYDDGEVNRHHTGGRHEYLLSGSSIACDVFINIPKLKTHKKAGITVSLKNLVGINGDKNWLPHHTVGTPKTGGDQFPTPTLRRTLEHESAQLLRGMALKFPGIGPRLLRHSRKAGKRVFGDTNRTIRSGNWYGNDTTWRMCLDLNKIMFYGKSDGTFRAPNTSGDTSGKTSGRKTYLSIVDGIIAGQGNGPMNPDPIDSGLLIFGSDPARVDATAAVLMGFEPERIPIVTHSFTTRGFPLTAAGDWRKVRCVSNVASWRGDLGGVFAAGDVLRFRAHFGWIGHCEIAAS